MVKLRRRTDEDGDPIWRRLLGPTLIAGGMVMILYIFVSNDPSGSVGRFLQYTESPDSQFEAQSQRPTLSRQDSDALYSPPRSTTSTRVRGVQQTSITPTLITPKLANSLQSASEEKRDFLEIASRTGTDKVWGPRMLKECLADPSTCRIQVPDMVNKKCLTGQGHFYHTVYNRWLGEYSTSNADPFQFLEVGFYNGKGFDAFKSFLPQAETHSIEIACIEPGPRNEGKWPWGNFASRNPRYQHYLDTNQLHCGDGSNYDFLHKVWTTEMKRPDAPPLKVVVDDGAHLASHMATTLFFWFPRIAPGGMLIVEDIEPSEPANQFRTHVLPQVMKDIHYCGDPRYSDKACFPTIQPLLQSVHCEMHICVFERNNEPAVEYDRELSMPPRHALDARDCLFSDFKRIQ